MAPVIRAHYGSEADLARQLEEHRERGAVLLPLSDPPQGLHQFDRVTVEVRLAELRAELDAEVLQVLPGLGLVLRLQEPELAASLLQDRRAVPPAPSPVRPLVTVEDEEQLLPPCATPPPSAEAGPPARTQGPLSWSVDKLQAEWHSLPVGDRVRVAKHGKRGARGLVLRGTDNTLFNVLLSNPGLTVEEVATLAGTGNVDPSVLKRILGSPDWMRHAAVARNLVCHPKATLTQAGKAADHLTDNELRQLTRTGKVRASVKRLLIKKLEQRALRERR